MSARCLSFSLVCWLGILQVPPAQASESAEEIVGWLQEYIQIDTTNPPGGERAATDYLAAILEREGIASRVFESPEGRASLYARLEAPGGPRPAIVLLHHVDVVAAGDDWAVEPFSGRRWRDKVWGRGALDVKGLGIAQLAAVLDLKRTGGTRGRDVILLAVADEEAGGGQGARWLLEAHPELFEGVEGVLNEGGSNRVLNDRLIWWGIEVTQKRPLWLRVTASGRGGHASGLHPHSATHKLVAGLARLLERPMTFRVTDAARMYLGTLARLEGGRAEEIYRLIEAGDGDELPNLPMAPGLPVYFLDTIQVTEIRNARGSNVVSPEAVANIDMRLLPDTDSGALLAEVRELLGEDLEIEVLLEAPEAPASPRDHPIYLALEEALSVRAPVVPTFISGTTDSRFFRQRGIPAYGFSPFGVNARDMHGIHGKDEAVPIDAFLRGVENLRRFLRIYAGVTD
ncbi:MAG: M20/M25/M40 family metallo-hydrolase [bacterium]|nr:M20/M25/M40 family metallo-hydrolase [bacterium]